MALTFQWSIGGCNCRECYPCSLPDSDLMLTVVVSGTGNNAGTYTAPLAFAMAGNARTWTSSCIMLNSKQTSLKFTISCTKTCTSYIASVYSGGTPCGGPVSYDVYDHPAGCSNTGGTALVLASSKCSPLNLVFTVGAFTYTITP
jgi:hypothetical protein